MDIFQIKNEKEARFYNSINSITFIGCWSAIPICLKGAMEALNTNRWLWAIFMFASLVAMVSTIFSLESMRATAEYLDKLEMKA